MKFLSNLLLCVVVVVGFGSIVAPVCGQSVPTPGTRGRTDPVQRELQRRFESEAIESALAARPRRSSDRERRTTLAQIKDDFLQIQIINDDLKQQTDMKSVARSASEINRRAARLKRNLSLPEVSTTSAPPRAEADTGLNQLPSLVSSLSNSINGFVENPIFESAKVIDARLSAQAGRDLRQIIVLSKRITKTSEKLRRARHGHVN
jgi:hypothetical protein